MRLLRHIALTAIVIPLLAKPIPYKVIGDKSSHSADAAIIALPGAAENSNIYCDIFSDGRYRKLAQQRGYLLVCLSGNIFHTRYEKQEREIIQLRDDLVARYPSIKKVFLTGYSTGGRGAFIIGMRHPEKFDGVAPVVPWMRYPGDTTRTFPEMTRRIRHYPHRIFFVSALFDFFFPFNRKDLNRFATAGEGHVEKKRYFTDHWFVVMASAKDIFDFFDRQRFSKEQQPAE